MTGSTIAWTAIGTSTIVGAPACDVALMGTAELGANSIRVPYSGTTCLGPVSGVEVLTKK
jgi:predicted naringenin-chalcone synthase